MRLISLVPVALLAGCAALITGPDADPENLSATNPGETERVRVMGAITGFNQDDPRIEIEPRNGNFLVRVVTYGDGCLTKGETEVEIDGMEATVTPFDYTAPAGTFCTSQLVSYTHEAVVDFKSAGAGTIHVRGLDPMRTSATHPRGETVVVSFDVIFPATP